MLPPDRPRHPGSVPDRPGCAGPDVTGGPDTDDDGRPDSIFADDGDDLLLHTDLDGDGFADRTLRLRPDGSTSVDEIGCADPPSLIESLMRWLRIG